jgi:hypothetical protein
MHASSPRKRMWRAACKHGSAGREAPRCGPHPGSRAVRKLHQLPTAAALVRPRLVGGEALLVGRLHVAADHDRAAAGQRRAARAGAGEEGVAFGDLLRGAGARQRRSTTGCMRGRAAKCDARLEASCMQGWEAGLHLASASRPARRSGRAPARSHRNRRARLERTSTFTVMVMVAWGVIECAPRGAGARLCLREARPRPRTFGPSSMVAFALSERRRWGQASCRGNCPVGRRLSAKGGRRAAACLGACMRGARPTPGLRPPCVPPDRRGDKDELEPGNAPTLTGPSGHAGALQTPRPLPAAERSPLRWTAAAARCPACVTHMPCGARADFGPPGNCTTRTSITRALGSLIAHGCTRAWVSPVLPAKPRAAGAAGGRRTRRPVPLPGAPTAG